MIVRGIFTAALCLLIAAQCYSQAAPALAREGVVVQCDKNSCPAGDTLWLKGYVLRDGRLSGNGPGVHAELWSDKGRLCAEALFPVLAGQYIGQLPVADSLVSGIYWLRVYTAAQAGAADSLTIVAISVYHPSDTDLLRMKKANDALQNSSLMRLEADTLDAGAGGYNSWQLKIDDTPVYHYSCSVSDAALPENDDMEVNGTIVGPDTGFLSWSGTVLRAGGRQAVKSGPLFAMLLQNNRIAASRLVPIGAGGRVALKGLFFFGNASLYYQPGKGGEAAKDVTLVLDTVRRPAFLSPRGQYLMDTLPFSRPVGTVLAKAGRQPVSEVKGLQLKEVKIRGWVNPRKALDRQYTAGLFSEPALYAFDLRKERYDAGLGDYLRMHLFTQGGDSMSDPPGYPGHPLLFYVNEELKTWDEISFMQVSDIAYIKAFESDFIGNDPFSRFIAGGGGFSLSGGGSLKVPQQATPMVVAIYTRKGKDIVPAAGLNSVAITGYTVPQRFVPADNKPALLWAPLIDANECRLRFYNNSLARRFRVTVRGFSAQGKELYYTTLLPK